MEQTMRDWYFSKFSVDVVVPLDKYQWHPFRNSTILSCSYIQVCKIIFKK